MKNDMPEEIWVNKNSWFYHDGNRQGGSVLERVKYIRADLAEPVCNCGPQQACEKCYVEPVIDDGLLAEAVEYVKQSLVSADDLLWVHINNIITHALKTREEPVEVTVEDMSVLIAEEIHRNTIPVDYTEIGDAPAKAMAKYYPGGIKIINPPTNRDEEKI